MGEAKRKALAAAEAAKLRGVYSEYLDRQMSRLQLDAERKAQLARIADLRGRAVFVMAADYRKGQNAPISIAYEDILPFKDLVGGVEGDSIDVILETPGGSAEVAEDLVSLLRDRFANVSFIIPGWAKSAGTIMAMAGDEILMEPASALGPIDAQIQWKDKIFSAEAFLEGLMDMKREAEDPEKGLNKAHIPILQQISPGEIQHAKNALDFARRLVADWLERYKFRSWTEHRMSKAPVTPEERQHTAASVAAELCKHQRWLTHGRSIKIKDLRDIGLEITDYSESAELYDAIRRYHTLLQMTFESNIYKLFETRHGIVVRFINVQPPPAVVQRQVRQQAAKAQSMDADIGCPLCRQPIPLQLKLQPQAPDEPGRIPYPKGDTVTCPHCKRPVNLAGARRELERQVGREVVPV
jgi:ClpP class serine protease